MSGLAEFSDDALFGELHKRGHMILIVLNAESLLEYAGNQEIELPEDIAAESCLMIWKNYDSYPEYEAIHEAALKEAKRIQNKRESALSGRASSQAQIGQ